MHSAAMGPCMLDSEASSSQTAERGWMQGNHSDLLVQLSHIHSILRGDTTGVKNEDSSQGFVRSTTKYWVRYLRLSGHCIPSRLAQNTAHAYKSSSTLWSV